MAGAADGEVRFVADAALGRLARYLRMLGYDTTYLRGRGAAEALREALATGRILLTRRRDIAARGRERACLITDDDVRRQLEAVARRFGLTMSARAMSRCIECNEPLRAVAKEEVLLRLPPHVRKTQEIFAVCPICDRIYWPGTHYARAVARLLATLRAAAAEG